jgi:hypothetical protein
MCVRCASQLMRQADWHCAWRLGCVAHKHVCVTCRTV